MTIIEKKVTGKKNQETCEDGIVVTDDYIAVVDGSTSKSPFSINPSMRNGRFCMKTICHFISTMDSDFSCQDFCLEVTSLIKRIYIQNEVDISHLLNHPTDRLTASAIIYSRKKDEVWMIGDCQCLLDGVLYENPKPDEEKIAKHRSLYINTLLNSGHLVEEFEMNDTGRTYILPELIHSCLRQNIDYAVIDGFDIPLDKVKILNAEKTSEIILASDGYPFLRNSLIESEKCIEHQLINDPLFIDTYKATKGLIHGNKSFDDRSYIKFKK